MLKFDYDALSKEFAADLNETLRGHSAKHESLGLWVSSENPSEGLSSLIEAALEYGETSFQIQIDQTTIAKKNLDLLKDQLKLPCRIKYQVEDIFYTIEVTAFQNEQNQQKSVLQDKLAREQSIEIDYSYGQSHKPKIADSLYDALQISQISQSYQTSTLPDTWQDVSHDNIAFTMHIDQQAILKSVAYTLQADNDITSKLLDIFADICIGLPIEEVLDHGVARLISRLTSNLSNEEKSALPAILLPMNLGPEFTNIHLLLREWRKQHFVKAENAGYNEYMNAVSTYWTQLSHNAQIQQLTISALTFCEEEDLNDESIQIDSLTPDLKNRPVRVFISISTELNTASHPEIITRFEKYLKRTLETELQVYYIESKDTNKIRRLGS